MLPFSTENTQHLHKQGEAHVLPWAQYVPIYVHSTCVSQTSHYLLSMHIKCDPFPSQHNSQDGNGYPAANDDVTGYYSLPSKFFHSQIFGIGISSILSGTRGLLGSPPSKH
uniref:Uncharacterized protein n=1 Tax=Opuntia streptacantha TaxID=393608 RepID=A0A7C9DUX8_OPUST